MSSDSYLPVGQRVVVDRYGTNQRDAIDQCMSLQPQEAPTLKDLQDGDIAVKVEATEIVWTDTVMATGQYQHRPKVGYSPGMNYCGTVVLLTPKAEKAGVKIGQRVAVSGMFTGPRSHGRHQKYGGLATYAIAPLRSLSFVPPQWSSAEAACSSYGYRTAYHCLVECGRVAKDEWIVIHGATGGVGIPAVRLAVAAGLNVIATTRSASKVEFLRSIGASHVIVLKTDDGTKKLLPFAKEVKAITGGKGAHVVYDGVGGDGITIESMRCLRFGGRLLVVGWAATPNVGKSGGARGTARPNMIPTNIIMMKGIQVIGCPAAIATALGGRDVHRRREKDLKEWAQAGRLPPPTVAEVFPMNKWKDALLSRVDSGSVVGCTVVEPQRSATSKL